MRSLIIKIRKTVKIFRRSPTKNDDIFLKHVKDEFGKEMQLILDVKTRWNSLLSMLERFFLVQNCIKKSLIDLNSKISFSDTELQLLSEIISALQPVKVAVENLCAQNINLYVADLTLKFMLNELQSQNSFLSNALFDELVTRINERRTPYSDVFSYLFNPASLNTNDYCIFNTSNKGLITKTIVQLLERFNENENCEASSETESSSNSSQDFWDPESIVTNFSSSVTLKEKLFLTIKNQLNNVSSNETSSSKNSVKDLTSSVRKEMTLFGEQGVRGKYLEKIFNYLKTIRPTSVESERAFSAAGYLCTKIRSRLGDNSLDTLAFLRSYFMKNDL